MDCYHGALQSVGSWDSHFEGHQVGSVVKVQHPSLFNSLAVASRDLSELSKLNLDEAFAEGFTHSPWNSLFYQAVSHYLSVDPAEAGAPDLVVVRVLERR